MINCTLTPDQIRVFRVKVAGDLLDIINDSQGSFTFDSYIKGIYDSVEKATSNKSLATEYVKIAPIMIGQLMIKPDVISIRKKGLSGDDVLDLIEEFSDPEKGLDNTVTYLGLNKSTRTELIVHLVRKLENDNPNQFLRTQELKAIIKNDLEIFNNSKDDHFCFHQYLISLNEIISEYWNPLQPALKIYDSASICSFLAAQMIMDFSNQPAFQKLKTSIEDQKDCIQNWLSGLNNVSNILGLNGWYPGNIGGLYTDIKFKENKRQEEITQDTGRAKIKSVLQELPHENWNYESLVLIFEESKTICRAHKAAAWPKEIILKNLLTDLYQYFLGVCGIQSVALDCIRNLMMWPDFQYYVGEKYFYLSVRIDPLAAAEFDIKPHKFDLLQSTKIEDISLPLDQRIQNVAKYLELDLIQSINTVEKIKKTSFKETKFNSKIHGFLFFDTETNGKALDFNAPVDDLDNWPRIAQLGWQVYNVSHELISEGSYLIKPDGWEIPQEQFFIDNNMSTERCEEFGIPISEALEKFLADLTKSKFLIAHNLSFDINVVGAELIRLNKSIPSDITQICTMKASTDFCAIKARWGFKWPTLTELHTKLFNEGFEGAHDALDDVKACARSFFKLEELGIIKTN